MKKILTSIGIVIFAIIKAQNTDIIEQQNADKKWTFGGGIGLGGSFTGNGNGFSMMIAPRVGYLLNSELEIGISANVSWFNSSYYNSAMMGAGPFATYYFNRSFYGSAVLQHYFIHQKNKHYDIKSNYQETALYIGGGYLQPIGNRAYMQIGLMYNVLYNQKSTLGSSLIPNMGIIIGL